MLKSMRVKNFQKHKDLKLDFDPGVNSIIGRSDAGKSAIVRAINWVVFNRPSGDSYIHHGETECKVGLFFDNGKVIKTKSAKTNEYSVDGNKLAKVSRTVPAEVDKLCNMDEGNFQFQFDKPYLIDDSAGQVAKTINKIASIDLIDSVIYVLNADRRGLNESLILADSGRVRVQGVLQAYSGVADVGVAVQNLVPSLDALRRAEREVEELVVLQRRRKECLKASACMLEVRHLIIMAGDRIGRIESLQRHTAVLNLMLRYKTLLPVNGLLDVVSYFISFDYVQREAALAKLKEDENILIKLQSCFKLKKLCAALHSLDSVHDVKDRLYVGNVNLTRMKQDLSVLDNAKRTIAQMKASLEKTKEEMAPLRKEFTFEVCPLCGSVK